MVAGSEISCSTRSSSVRFAPARPSSRSSALRRDRSDDRFGRVELMVLGLAKLAAAEVSAAFCLRHEVSVAVVN